MYKLLLCWRYLRTRYIALVCIVSVTLGVATMIVVNSVMAGFAAKMQSEMNAMLGDLVLQVHSMDGAPDADAHMAAIRNAVGDKVVGMSPTAAVPALIYMQVGGSISTRPVTLVGIDSVMAPRELRVEAWSRLARDLDAGKLEAMTREITLAGAIPAAAEILAGKVRGRLVVNVNA